MAPEPVPAAEKVRCSCGWSAPATKETAGALAKEHIRQHRNKYCCATCGEWFEYCCCPARSDGSPHADA